MAIKVIGDQIKVLREGEWVEQVPNMYGIGKDVVYRWNPETQELRLNRKFYPLDVILRTVPDAQIVLAVPYGSPIRVTAKIVGFLSDEEAVDKTLKEPERKGLAGLIQKAREYLR